MKIKMTSAEYKLLKKQRNAFRRKFGRDPGPDDPLFFDSNAGTPQFMSDQAITEIQRQMSQAAAKAGIAPEIIYAMNKTGLILSEMNIDYASDEDVAAWEAAIEEYGQTVRKRAKA